MVETMKIKLISFLLILVCYGVHAAPRTKVENNFASDDFACPDATFNNNDDVLNYFKQWKGCNKIAYGKYKIYNAETIDFSAFKDVTIVGQLNFYNSDFSNIATIFPNLTTADSILFEHSTNLSNLSFPSLYNINYTIIRDSTDLTAKLFPALKQTEQLSINNSTNLETLSFPLLDFCSVLEISNNKQATNLDHMFPKLTTADGIKIFQNDQIKNVQFPVLKSLTSLNVYSNKLLQKVSIPELKNSAINLLRLGVNNDYFDQIGGDKGGLTDIIRIDVSLTLTNISTRFTLTHYPKSIRAIHFNSDIPKFELRDIVSQLYQLNPQYTKDKKTMVVLWKNTCQDVGDVDTSKYGFDIYSASTETKCGK